jgi:hypothetical protein
VWILIALNVLALRENGRDVRSRGWVSSLCNFQELEAGLGAGTPSSEPKLVIFKISWRVLSYKPR